MEFRVVAARKGVSWVKWRWYFRSGMPPLWRLDQMRECRHVRLSNLEKAIYEKDSMLSNQKNADTDQEVAPREDTFAPRKRK
ncbi:hypothetical protein C0Q44_28665 [Paenibacillus sp. PCH8]|nr:hypothetical protein C0Q44_28665 [Paenibacillus sp. PCH8]